MDYFVLDVGIDDIQTAINHLASDRWVVHTFNVYNLADGQTWATVLMQRPQVAPDTTIVPDYEDYKRNEG